MLFRLFLLRPYIIDSIDIHICFSAFSANLLLRLLRQLVSC